MSVDAKFLACLDSFASPSHPIMNRLEPACLYREVCGIRFSCMSPPQSVIGHPRLSASWVHDKTHQARGAIDRPRQEALPAPLPLLFGPTNSATDDLEMPTLPRLLLFFSQSQQCSGDAFGAVDAVDHGLTSTFGHTIHRITHAHLLVRLGVMQEVFKTDCYYYAVRKPSQYLTSMKKKKRACRLDGGSCLCCI